MEATARRNFDECLLIIERHERILRSFQEIDDYLPITDFWIYKRQEDNNRTYEDVEREFKAIVEDRRLCAKWLRGQWCVPVFRGGRAIVTEETEVSMKLSLRASIQDEEQRRRLMQTGSEAIKDFRNSIAPAGVTPVASYYPADINASLTDQAVPAEPTDTVGPLAQREVFL